VKRRTGRPPRRFTRAHAERLDRAATHYLRACYRNRTAARVAEFAAHLGRNRDYLSRTAGAIAGMSLRSYLRVKQLQYAEQLLKITPLTIPEIALRAGFGTTSTFYRCFRARYGMPPASYRETLSEAPLTSATNTK
jgi:AraC-like DNA-binding protein